jgi:hypothetical protein
MDGDKRRRLELTKEQWHRRCQREFIPFCVEALTAKGETPALHHRLIASHLQRLPWASAKVRMF